jgi:hypothetical protein
MTASALPTSQSLAPPGPSLKEIYEIGGIAWLLETLSVLLPGTMAFRFESRTAISVLAVVLKCWSLSKFYTIQLRQACSLALADRS